MKNSIIIIILFFLALGEARRSTRLANVLSKQNHHRNKSFWFFGPASADNDENDIDAIKEVKDGDTAKEVNDDEKKVDAKLEITATHNRWRPFGSGFFTRRRVAQK